MNNWKSWLESRTVWSALLALAPIGAGLLGFDVNAVLSDILVIAGSLGAIVFRIKASKKVGSPSN